MSTESDFWECRNCDHVHGADRTVCNNCYEPRSNHGYTLTISEAMTHCNASPASGDELAKIRELDNRQLAELICDLDELGWEGARETLAEMLTASDGVA